MEDFRDPPDTSGLAVIRPLEDVQTVRYERHGQKHDTAVGA